jgi:signal transduction histidine kinase
MPTSRRRAWLAWTLPAFTLGLTAATLVYGAIRAPHSVAGTWTGWLVTTATVVFVCAFAIVGAIITSRRPENPIGWLMGVAALCYAAGTVSAILADVPGRHPLSEWLGNWVWGIGAVIPLTFIPLLFPDGALPSRRWRPALWAASAGLASFVVGSMFVPGVIADTSSVNPFGIGGDTARSVFDAMRAGGLALVLLMTPVALASLVVRFRRADRLEREQFRWLIYAAVLIIVAGIAGSFITSSMRDPRAATDLQNAITSLSAAFVPVAIGIAILKYRLYDIDVVIRKTVVYAVLAAFITVVYAAVVVGIGALVGTSNSLALSVAATAIVAVAFQPVRERANRAANRVVYGRRSTPYEVLARFGERVASTYAADDVLPRIARVVGEATRAERVDVWLRVGDAWRQGASWPTEWDATAPVPPDGAGSTDVRHGGELLGAIAVRKPANDPVTPSERGLLADLAGQAGLVLSNARLTTELQARVDELGARTEELRHSRRRIVAAHDRERRALERNIHDGAQQHMVALAVKLRLARAAVTKDAAAGAEMVRALEIEVGDAIETMTSLALGIYPPVLEERGVAAALEAQAGLGRLRITVEADGFGRAPIETEAAIYFCCLEAMQNAAKYAEPTEVTVRLWRRDGTVAFEVTDDGRGFDPATTPPGSGLRNMADRLAVLGGSIDVTSAPGHGTTVRGSLPSAQVVTA